MINIKDLPIGSKFVLQVSANKNVQLFSAVLKRVASNAVVLGVGDANIFASMITPDMHCTLHWMSPDGVKFTAQDAAIITPSAFKGFIGIPLDTGLFSSPARRQHPRYPYTYRITVSCEGHEKMVDCIDISIGGLSFKHPTAISLTTTVKVELFNPKTQETHVYYTKVRNCGKVEGSMLHRIGVEFSNIDAWLESLIDIQSDLAIA